MAKIEPRHVYGRNGNVQLRIRFDCILLEEECMTKGKGWPDNVTWLTLQNAKTMRSWLSRAIKELERRERIAASTNRVTGSA